MPSNGEHQRVAAADLVRNFSHWRQVGAREPIYITHHGRETHVFVAKELLGNVTEESSSPVVDRSMELASHISQGLIFCDKDLAIRFVNEAAVGLANRESIPQPGTLLTVAFPQISGTLMQNMLRHSLNTGGNETADIPSPFRADCWLNAQSFHFDSGVALLFRDITENVRQHRLANVRDAMAAAMALHGGIGCIRVSARGFVESVNEAFCGLIGLSSHRLEKVLISDLVETASRHNFRGELESVLSGEKDVHTRTSVLTNDGTTRPIDISISRLRGLYGTEGAMILTTSPCPTF